MTSGRRADAPRLIEWTGERCVPWAPDVQAVYEHLHRYMWAAELVVGRRVLDLASGEGFGAAILAESAEHVTGIDIDRRTVDHSSLNYGDDGIEFEVGDATDLTRFADGSFGAVVAFEMIEHVHDQGRVLAEIERIFAPDGLLIISTPDRPAYTDATGSSNPFHVHELDFEGFSTLMGGAFEHMAIWGQRTITGSALAALDDSRTAFRPHGHSSSNVRATSGARRQGCGRCTWSQSRPIAVAGDPVAVDARRLRAGAATRGGGRERECRARATRRGAVTAEPARRRARRTRACGPRSEPAARRPRARGQARSRTDRPVDRGCRAEWRRARGLEARGRR